MEHTRNPSYQVVDVVRIYQDACIADHLWDGSNAAGDDRGATGHGFQWRQTEPFV